MDCPKCETRSLESTTIKGVEVDRCNKCRGIWFDDTELSALLGFTKKDLRSLRSGKEDESRNLRRGHCPRDGSELLRVYSPANHAVVLDTCVQCRGIWLDGGELSKLTSS